MFKTTVCQRLVIDVRGKYTPEFKQRRWLAFLALELSLRKAGSVSGWLSLWRSHIEIR